MAVNFNGDYGYLGYNRPPVTYWLPVNALEAEALKDELDYYIGPPDMSQACLRDLTLIYNLDGDNSCFEGSSLNYFYIWVRHKAHVYNVDHSKRTYGSIPDIPSLSSDRVTIAPEHVSIGSNSLIGSYFLQMSSAISQALGGKSILYSGRDISETDPLKQQTLLENANNTFQLNMDALIAEYLWGFDEDFFKSNHYKKAYVTGVWTRYKITVNWDKISKYTRLISIVFPVYMQTANSNIEWVDPEEGKGDITTKYEVVLWRINIKMAQTVVDNPVVPTDKNYWCYDFPVKRFTLAEKEYLLKVRYPQNAYTDATNTKLSTTIPGAAIVYPFGVSVEVNGALPLHNAWPGLNYKPSEDVQKTFRKTLTLALMSTYPVVDRLNMEISSSIWYLDAKYLSLTAAKCDGVWPDTILYDAPVLALTAFKKKSTVAYGALNNEFSATGTLCTWYICKIDEFGAQRYLGYGKDSDWKYNESGGREYPKLQKKCVNIIDGFPYSYSVTGDTYSFTTLLNNNANPTCLISPSQYLIELKKPTTKDPITYLIVIRPNIDETTSKELANYYGVAEKRPTLFQWTIKVYNKDLYPNITDPNTINNVSEEYIDTEALKYTTSEQDAYNMNLRCIDTNEGTAYSSTSLLLKQNSSNYYSTMKSKDLILFAGNYNTENNTRALFTEMNSILSSVKEGSLVSVYTPYTREANTTETEDSFLFKKGNNNVYSCTCKLKNLALTIQRVAGTTEDIYLFGMVIESPKATEDPNTIIFENGSFSASTLYLTSITPGFFTISMSSIGNSTLYFSEKDSKDNFTLKINSVSLPFVDQYGVFDLGLKLSIDSSTYIQIKYPQAVTYKNYKYNNTDDKPIELSKAKSRTPWFLPATPLNTKVPMPTTTVSGLSAPKMDLYFWGIYLNQIKLNLEDAANPYLNIEIGVLAPLLTDTTWLSLLNEDTALHSAVRLSVCHVSDLSNPLRWGGNDPYTVVTYSSKNRVYGKAFYLYKYLDDLYVYTDSDKRTSYATKLTDKDGNLQNIYMKYLLYLSDLIKVSGTTYTWVHDPSENVEEATAEDVFKNFGLNYVWQADYIVYADTTDVETSFGLDEGTVVGTISNIFRTECNAANQVFCTGISSQEGDIGQAIGEEDSKFSHVDTLVRMQPTTDAAVKPTSFDEALLNVLFTYLKNEETKYHILEDTTYPYEFYTMLISEEKLSEYAEENSIFSNIIDIPEYKDSMLEVSWYSNLQSKTTKTQKMLRVVIPGYYDLKKESYIAARSYSTDYSIDNFTVKTSFLYWHKNRSGETYLTDVPELLKSEEKYKVFNVAKVSNDVDYDYTPYMNNSSREKKVFKANEEYKLGIVFKYLDGTVSPVYEGSYVNTNKEEVGLKKVWIPNIEPSIVSVPEIEDYATTDPILDSDIESQKRFITAKKSVRVLLLHPYISKVLNKYNITSIIPVRLHRSNTKIKALGILNPGVTAKDLNNTIGIDAQYDWFYRETLVNHAVWLPSYKSDTKTASCTPTSNSTNNTTGDKKETLWTGGTGNKYAPDWINNFDIEILSLDDSSRESEKTGLVSSGTLLTFNSPELEMDESFSLYMLQGTRLRHLKTYRDVTYGNNVELLYNGANRLSSFETSDIYQNTGTLSGDNGLDMVYPDQYLDAEDLGSVDALKEMYEAVEQDKSAVAALKVSLKGMKHHKFKSGFLWYGYGPFGVTSTEDAIKKATLITDVTENYAFFKVYPWMRNRLGGEVGDEYTIKTKRYFSQTYATGASYYLPAIEDVYISGVTISNSQTNIIHKLYNITTGKSCLYQGTTDAIVVASALNSQGAYRIRCRGDWYQQTTSKNSEGKGSTTYTKLKDNSWCYTTAPADAGGIAPSIGGILSDLCRDPIQMRYKAAPHAVFFFNGGSMSTSKKGINVGELYNVNELPELRTENYIQGTWIPCGKQVPISLDRNWTTIVFEEGDFFFGRFDSLRTQPYSDDDVNQVTEVVSTMLCSRINLDARYDSNRGVKTSTISNTNFNLRNPVYDLLNNYFTYSYQDVKDLNSSRLYKSTIQWSLQKTMGEDIDSWCNIQDSNFLDFNGTLGSIISINTLGNNIIVFQENGIAVLQYNEKTLLATNTGIPVEIANSNKVEGKYYISLSIGCQKAKAIAETPSGIYFIDSTRKTLYYLAPNLELKDISILGLKAWSKKNLDKNWYTVYDSIAEEVLFINSDEALVYNIAHQCFTSFLTYGGIKHWFRMGPYTCQVKPLSYELVADLELILGKDTGIYNSNYSWNSSKSTPTITIWARNTKEACSLFGTVVPQTIEWICNPSPLNDKVFTNIQYRADAFCEDDTYISDDTFDTIRLIDEYQDTYKNILYWKKHTSSNLKKKFRIWNIALPRALETTDITDQYAYTRDRIRNMWCKILLKHDSGSITNTGISKGYWKQVPYKEDNSSVILDTTDLKNTEWGTALPSRDVSYYLDGDTFTLVDTNKLIIHKYVFHKSARFVFYDALVSYLPC